MYRKLVAAFVAMMLAVGGLFAEEVSGIFKKFEDGKVTVSVDGKEKTYAVDPKAAIKFKTKDGTEKEVPLTKMFGRAKDGANIVLQVEDNVVKGAKLKRKGK